MPSTFTGRFVAVLRGLTKQIITLCIIQPYHPVHRSLTVTIYNHCHHR